MPRSNNQGTRQPLPRPLSVATRRRLLAGLLKRAEAGDTAAAESLIRLGNAVAPRATAKARRRGRATGAPVEPA